jgi:hypothetical protein
MTASAEIHTARLRTLRRGACSGYREIPDILLPKTRVAISLSRGCLTRIGLNDSPEKIHMRYQQALRAVSKICGKGVAPSTLAQQYRISGHLSFSKCWTS